MSGSDDVQGTSSESDKTNETLNFVVHVPLRIVRSQASLFRVWFDSYTHIELRCMLLN